MRSAAFSPIMKAAAFVCAVGGNGIILVSDTLKFFIPWTFNSWLTTVVGLFSGPIRHVAT